MLAIIDTRRREATKQLDQSKRSELGQYMTPSMIARFMASFFEKADNKLVSILDAGAGIGTLSFAIVDRIVNKWGKSKNVAITTYEIDRMLQAYQRDNFKTYNSIIAKSGKKVSLIQHQNDFIEAAAKQLLSTKQGIYTHAILNPPYKKINSESRHRKLLSSVGIETVNLYSAFVALSILLLKKNGELVAIIPRSFCNGNYYKSFRQLIIKSGSIKQIHLFESRNQAFKEDDVLQENIILHFKKGAPQKSVIISRSTNGSLSDFQEQKFSFSEVVKPNDKEAFIHIPQSGENFIEKTNAIKCSLNDLDLQVSTGPVVDFRSRPFIFMNPEKDTVPLLYPTHFNGTGIEWPKAGKKPNAISFNAETKKMCFPSGFYVVVKRFSSKEEKQRIVARVINPNKLEYNYIGIENHLNVFHYEKKGILEDLAYGVAAYLNSGIVDSYFRTFNGHTQVNATDLKQMKYPNKDALLMLGKWAKKLVEFEPAEIDKKIKAIL